MGQGHRQTRSLKFGLKLGFRQIEAIEILSLSNEKLAEYLAERAAQNPLIRLRPPVFPDAPTREPVAEEIGLYAHVTAQLPLILRHDEDQPLAMACLDALDPSGWLGRAPEEIAADTGFALPDLQRVLALLQKGIEPAGLFALDLCDCLRLQAEDREEYDPAMALLLAHLPLLTEGLEAIMGMTTLPRSLLAQALSRLRRYAPQPGLAFSNPAAPPREPDILIEREGAQWRISLNRSTLPALDLAPMEGGLATARAEAKWLDLALKRRNHTVLRVVRSVMKRQSLYLHHGPAALHNLNRSEIAAELVLHPSTISRIARDLLLQTPFGLCTLASLFNPQRRQSEDMPPRLAPPAIQHRLAELIGAEDPRHPLSDNALCALLGAEGNPIARRTVTKFRQAIGIPPRSARRAG